MITQKECIEMKKIQSLRIINGKVPVIELEHTTIGNTSTGTTVTFFSMISDANV
jgi:hypothetical protein